MITYDHLFEIICVHAQALEAIRKLRLEKVQEVRELKLKLDHLKTHKEMAVHLSSEISDSQAVSHQMKSQMEEFQNQINVGGENTILL